MYWISLLRRYAPLSPSPSLSLSLSLSLSVTLHLPLSFERKLMYTAKKWHFHSYVLRKFCVSSTQTRGYGIGHTFDYSQLYPIPSCRFSVSHILNFQKFSFFIQINKEMPIFYVVIFGEEVPPTMTLCRKPCM